MTCDFSLNETIMRKKLDNNNHISLNNNDFKLVFKS